MGISRTLHLCRQRFPQPMQRLKQHCPLRHCAAIQQVFQVRDVTDWVGAVGFDRCKPRSILSNGRRIRKAADAPISSRVDGRPVVTLRPRSNDG